MDEAFDNMLSILNDGVIRASKVKGFVGDKYGISCACLTESPLNLIPTKGISLKYSFGLIFDKKLIYNKGGRPVIYQHYEEFDELKPAVQWKHVTFNPDIDEFDLAEQREWRIKDSLSVSDSSAIILPNKDYAERLYQQYNINPSKLFSSIQGIFYEEDLYAYDIGLPWLIVLLEDYL